LLKREWWKFYTQVPEMNQVIHTWDLSTGKSELGDFSAYHSMGRTEDGYYILDAGRWKLGMDALIAKMTLLFEQSRPRPQYLVVEEAGSSIPVVESIRNHSRLPLMPVKPGTSDKVSRVKAIQALVEAGRVWVPSVASWLQEWMDEMAAFPGGRYDDWVDSLSQGLAWLDKEGSGGDTFVMKRYDPEEPRRHSHLKKRGRMYAR